MHRTPERLSISDTRRNRAALRQAVPAVLALCIIQGTLLAFDPEVDASAWARVWSFLPLMPAIWLVWGQVQVVRRADEFQRVAQLEAMSIGFAVTIMLAFVGGLLDGADMGDSRQSLQVTFIGGVVAWLVALAVRSRG
jgi:hypothetical protein